MISEQGIAPGAAAVEEAKAYLRIAGGDEDALVARLIASAAMLCEQFTGQALLTRAFVETIPASGAWTRLGLGPVRAIVQAESLAADGSAAVLPADAYAVDIDANGDGWVRVAAPGGAKRLRVTYEAGLSAAWTAVPEALRQGVVRLAAHMFSHRDAAADAGPPAAVTALWRPWRRIRL